MKNGSKSLPANSSGIPQPVSVNSPLLASIKGICLISHLQRTVSRIIDSFISEDDAVLYNKALCTNGMPFLDLSSNMLNVCIFTLKIGMGLKYPRDALERLGMRAIFHDIGTAKVTEDILKKPERLTTVEVNRRFVNLSPIPISRYHQWTNIPVSHQ